MLDRLNALLLALLLALAPLAPARASQNQLLSPTTGTVSGLQLTNAYNSALDSLNTCNSGATAPVNQLSGTPSLGNCWLNSTAAPYPVQMNDGASSWPAFGYIDPTAHAWNLQIGGGAATLSSAATVDLCSTPRNYLTISGTATITSFGSSCPAGVVKLVTFSGAASITYNAASLIIPGAASVTPTAAGDQATLVALGGGNWQVATYTPASGTALINPAVDVCSYVMTAGFNVPSSKYLLAYGQAISRTTYATFLACATTTQSVTRTTGSPTLTGFSDTSQIPIGAGIEGTGVPTTTTTIVSCTSTTCTMSGNATSSGTANVTVFPYGNGNGSTTFNMPSCSGRTLAGRDNMGGTPAGVLTSSYFSAGGASPDALGALGGSQSHTLALSETPAGIASSASASLSVSVSTTLPGQVPQASVWNGTVTASSSGGFTAPYSFAAITFSAGPFSGTGTATGTVSSTSTNTGGGAHSIVQPVTTANCLVRVLAMAAPQDGRQLAGIAEDAAVANRVRIFRAAA